MYNSQNLIKQIQSSVYFMQEVQHFLQKFILMIHESVSVCYKSNLHESRLTEQVFSLWNWLWTRQNRFKIWVDQCSYKAQKHLLLLKSKNFHLTDGKILVPLQKGGSILPSRTLVRAIQADRAVVGIWRVDNTKVVATSKRRPISIVTVDCIPLFSSYQW